MVITSQSHQALLAAAERFVSNGRARIGPLALEGDVPGLAAALRRGVLPELVKTYDWPLPPALKALEFGDAVERIGMSDEILPFTPGVAILRPPSLVIGVDEGGRRELPVAEIRRLTVMMLADAQLSISCVAGVLRARQGVSCTTVALDGAGSTGRIVVEPIHHGDVSLCVARRMRLGKLPDTSERYSWSEIVEMHGPSH